MKQKPSFQLYPQDFLGSIDFQLMNATEVGVYFLLLLNLYNNGGILPSNIEDLAALCRGVSPSDRVLKKFYKEGDNLRNKRCDEELAKKSKFTKLMSEAGKRGNEKRWKKAKVAESPTPSPSNRVGDKQAIASDRSSTSSSSSNTPLTPQGAEVNEKFIEAEKKLIKWFKGMEDVSNSIGLAKEYLAIYPPEIILSALNDSACTNRAKFVELANYRLKKAKNDNP